MGPIQECRCVHLRLVRLVPWKVEDLHDGCWKVLHDPPVVPWRFVFQKTA